MAGLYSGLYSHILGAMNSKKRQIIYRTKYGQAAPEPYRVVNVETDMIEYILAPRYHADLFRRGTYIKNGDWDRRLSDGQLVYAGRVEEGFDSDRRVIVRYEDYVFYKSSVQHFERGVPWKDTEFYEWLVDNLSEDIYRYNTKEEIRNRLSYIDKLYSDMCDYGYKSQQDLQSNVLKPPGYDEVLVNIGRDGRYILDDGRHRVTLAKIIGIEEIPVRVFVRHSDWQQHRHTILTSNFQGISDSDYYELGLDHPDLVDL